MAQGAVIGALRAELSASVAEFEKDMGKAARAVDSFEKRWDTMAARLAKAGAVASVALTAPLLLFAKKSVQAFAESEKAVASIEQTLNTMGEVAGFTGKQLQEMATKLQKVTAFGDEPILEGVIGTMLRFGRIQGQVFERAAALTLDYAQATKSALPEAATLIGKALQDPEKGLTRLARAGIMFSHNQEQVIKKLFQTGQVAKAQSLILDEIERKFGGQAAAFAGTTMGRLAQLNNQWGDFQERVGAIIAKVLPPLIELLSKVVEWLDKADDKTLQWVVGVGALAAAIGPLLLLLGGLVKVIGTAVRWIGAIGGALGSFHPLVRLAMAAVAAFLIVWESWGEITAFVKKVLDEIGGYINDFINFLDDVFPGVKRIIGWAKEAYEGVALWLGTKLEELFNKAKKLVQGFSDFVSASIDYARTGRMSAIQDKEGRYVSSVPIVFEDDKKAAAAAADMAKFRDADAASMKRWAATKVSVAREADRSTQAQTASLDRLRETIYPVETAMRKYAESMAMAKSAGFDMNKAQVAISDELFKQIGGLEKWRHTWNELPKVLQDAAKRAMENAEMKRLDERFKQWNEDVKRLAEHMNDAFDPAQKRDRTLRDLDAAWNQGLITNVEVFRKAQQQAWKEFGDGAIEASETLKMVDAGFGHILDSLEDLVLESKNWKDVLKDLSKTLAKDLFLRPGAAAMKNALGGLLGGLTGDPGAARAAEAGRNILDPGAASPSGGGWLSSLFSGLFAEGGTIPKGHWGMVGERGPEPVFAGETDMHVMPSGSMGPTQNFYISTPDANSFRASQRQVARMARQKLSPT